MEVTEVRIKLMEEAGERLQAFCSITFDDSFVIRDLKIIEGTHGPFVAMPSRKLTAHCSQCGCKNHLKAAYCNQCGSRLRTDRAVLDDEGRAKLYADIAHPINSACREMIQERVVREFRTELERAKLPGYVSRYDDLDHDENGPPRSLQGESKHSDAKHKEHKHTEVRHGDVPRPVVEHTHVQPAETHPRGPHRHTTSPQTVPSTPHANTRHPQIKPAKLEPENTKPGDFGAGIF